LQGTSRQRNTNHVSAFPLPTDFGYWVLTENKDFRLPYPISQEIDDIRLKMASKRKPPPYKHISSNRYVSRPKLPGEIMICQCPPTGTCDETCVNRQTQYLCHPKHCPCGERCTNVQFGKRKSIKTEVHYYGARGFGLRTKEPIAKGQFIDEYRGEVVDYNEMVRRVRDHYKDTGNYYLMIYDAPAGEMLDGGLKGNITRYANHSCDPNCGIQKWLVCGTDEQRAGEFQVALFASRDIAAGEELTYDYGWSAFSPKTVTGEAGEACHCGAANCSGVMGVRK
ncbi:SET domain-containing protein, partial [Meira miltonrushii]